MQKLEQLAELIYPNIHQSILDLEQLYPKRNLPEGAMVTRFAPSPTGFLHTGSLFASTISWRLAKQSGGVFFVRLEDTDTKREITGTGELVLKELAIFGVQPDESFVGGGAYGPYRQSERKAIYHAVIKDMIKRGLAYPCFCTHEELDEMRVKQEALKVNPGYYGDYAVCRKLTVEEQIAKVQNGAPYVIRFKSPGNPEHKVTLHDRIRGDVEFPENDQDIVIMKGDELPTYHFAHLVDDHFMRTTHVTRGEEWMASVPIHLQLFTTVGWPLPEYAHLPVIMKLDEGRRRKLSKRKDKEAAVSFFLEDGYPIEGIMEYLMTIANTNFEEWRLAHPQASIYDFPLSFEKMTLDGALFDLEKVKSISKERLGALNAEEIAAQTLSWAKKFQPDFARLIEQDYRYFERILSIERGGEKPRKDYDKFSDILPIIGFMFDEVYAKLIQEPIAFNERFDKETLKKVLQAFRSHTGLELPEEEWFGSLKEVAVLCGFSAAVKDYKKNPELYLGHVGDIAEIVRLAVSTKKSTPNFYRILSIMGSDRVQQRIHTILASL